MRLSWYIARRYLFSKKSKNAINYITSISVALVAIVTMSLVITMSVFNGLTFFVTSLFNQFDPEIRITAKTGGVFSPDSAFVLVQEIPSLQSYSEVLEEDVLLSYDNKQLVGKIKGVSPNYSKTCEMDSLLIAGDFEIFDSTFNFVVVGQGVAHSLSIGIYFKDALHIYAPKRTKTVSYNPTDDFIKKYAYPRGIFSVQQDIDSRYVLSSIHFARDLWAYTNSEVSSIEIKLKQGSDKQKVIEEIQSLIGGDFDVKNQQQQHAFLYKITQSEKLITFLIVSLILIIASFSIVGSLTMLIIDKQRDISILKSMGATNALVKRLFILEGWMISILGAIIGLILGLGLSLIQEQFGIIKLGNPSDMFIVDAYPVIVQWLDSVCVLAMVLGVGFVAAYYPVKFVSKKYFE